MGVPLTKFSILFFLFYSSIACALAMGSWVSGVTLFSNVCTNDLLSFLLSLLVTRSTMFPFLPPKLGLATPLLRFATAFALSFAL